MKSSPGAVASNLSNPLISTGRDVNAVNAHSSMQAQQYAINSIHLF